MAIYKPVADGPILGISNNQRNQRVLSGINPALPLANGVFFLETLIVASGVEILDGKGNSVGTGITSFNHDQSPLRLDYGVTITGTVTYAKGYFVEGVLP